MTASWKCQGEQSVGVHGLRESRTYEKRSAHASTVCPTSTMATRNILWTRFGISKWILTATTREGKRVEVQGCDFYTFRAGKVIRKDSYWKIIE